MRHFWAKGDHSVSKKWAITKENIDHRHRHRKLMVENEDLHIVIADTTHHIHTAINVRAYRRKTKPPTEIIFLLQNKIWDIAFIIYKLTSIHQTIFTFSSLTHWYWNSERLHKLSKLTQLDDWWNKDLA